MCCVLAFIQRLIKALNVMVCSINRPSSTAACYSKTNQKCYEWNSCLQRLFNIIQVYRVYIITDHWKQPFFIRSAQLKTVKLLIKEWMHLYSWVSEQLSGSLLSHCSFKTGTAPLTEPPPPLSINQEKCISVSAVINVLVCKSSSTIVENFPN